MIYTSSDLEYQGLFHFFSGWSPKYSSGGDLWVGALFYIFPELVALKTLGKVQVKNA